MTILFQNFDFMLMRKFCLQKKIVYDFYIKFVINFLIFTFFQKPGNFRCEYR